MNLINKGDFLDILTKAKQRGLSYFVQKISLNERRRTQSTFSSQRTQASNWWIIPAVKQRENEKISGKPQESFETYLIDNHLAGKSELKLLSIGCGLGNREIKLAESGVFREVTGIDLSDELINQAKAKAHSMQLKNISFNQADFYHLSLPPDYYDVILFHSSLHHFKQIEKIAIRIQISLKGDGLLVLKEYTGPTRLQFNRDQILHMNRLLTVIPKHFRKRHLSGITKRKVYAPGLIRMIISDPSEAIESEKIIPIIHKHFKILEEKKTGGDLLMMVLKDISHHFTNVDDNASQSILTSLFALEDKYLEYTKQPNFIFGIYQNSKPTNS